MKKINESKEELLEILRELVVKDALDGFYDFYGDKTKEELVEAIENF